MERKQPHMTSVPTTPGLSTSQAARLLGVSTVWVRELILAGELVATRSTHGYLISPESVVSYQRKKGRPMKQQ
jgi:excisionase family DNA binding protein